MTFTLRTDIRSKNVDERVIPVEFIVIHYTACSLNRALSILCDPVREVSAHLVIDIDGTVYELIPCLEVPPLRGRHAGKSHWNDSEGKAWDAFNDFSIGIELVNENGNILPYTDAQYQSLEEVIMLLQKSHPALSNPARIIGHEQIAGFRGKSDPGRCFDWTRVLNTIYTGQEFCQRPVRLSAEIETALRVLASKAPVDQPERDVFFSHLSVLIESIPAIHPTI